MKILHLTISGELTGGGDTIIANILFEKKVCLEEQLATFYWSTFMENLSKNTDVKYYHPKKNVNLIMRGRLWAIEMIVRNIPFIFKLIKIIKNEKIDIVHAHGFPSLVASLVIKSFCNVKIVYTHHSFRSKTSILEKFFLTMLYNKTDANTGVSLTACNSMNNNFPGLKNKFINVYNCVSKEFLNKNIISSGLFTNQRKEGRKIFVQVARFHKIKNQMSIAEAVNSLSELDKMKVFVVFLGDGEEKRGVEEYVKNNKLDKNFLFMGAVSPSLVPSIMSECDYGLFPSELEGFGLGAVECMTLGLPVIALNNELMIEVVGDSGVLVNKEDIDKAFIKMLNIGDSLRQKTIDRAKIFSSLNMKNGYFDVYNKILPIWK